MPILARRRRVATAVAGMLALGCLADVGWQSWLPHWRPGLRAGERLGVDVSSHQGAIDWGRVRGDGITFAYVKATEGMADTDPTLAANWAGAGAAGLARGAYHVFTLCTSGGAQAAHFVAAVPAGAMRAALPPAVDLELAGNCAARPAVEQVRRELAAFLGVVGGPVTLYVGSDFAGRYGAALPAGDARWVRRLYLRPGGAWTLWQASGRSVVAGIAGDVDLDVLAADRLAP